MRLLPILLVVLMSAAAQSPPDSVPGPLPEKVPASVSALPDYKLFRHVKGSVFRRGNVRKRIDRSALRNAFSTASRTLMDSSNFPFCRMDVHVHELRRHFYENDRRMISPFFQNRTAAVADSTVDCKSIHGAFVHKNFLLGPGRT